MTATLPDLATIDPDELRRIVQQQHSTGRDHFPDAVLDAVRALTGEPPMPYLAPARKLAKKQLARVQWGKVTAHRDPTGDTATRMQIRRTVWRTALAESFPDTIPARALDNLAILCAA